MAHTSSINDQALDAISQQIGELLRDIAEPSLLNANSIEIRESFELWTLELDALVYGVTTQNMYLRQLARPTGRWHHQITFDDKAEAFARTSISSTGEGHHVLEELFISPLARHVDEAINWVDQNTQDLDDPLVYLLVAPAHYLHAFWLTNDATGTSYVLPIDIAAADNFNVPVNTLNSLGNFLTGQLYSDSQFLSTLTQSLPSLRISLRGGGFSGPPLSKP